MKNLKLNSAQQKLFDSEQGLVNATANRYYRGVARYSQSHAADLRQQLEIALAKAAQSYDPTKGAAFKTYAARSLDNAAKDYLRKLKRTPTTESYDVIARYERGDHPGTSRELTRFDAIEREQAAAEQYIGLNDDDNDSPLLYEYGDDLDKAVNAIPLRGEQRAVLLLNLKHDLDCAEIAHVFGIRESVVTHALYKAREKLRAFGKKDAA